MRQIRRCVFETNSSSTHSVSIKKTNKVDRNEMYVREDGYIHVSLGEFGWEIYDYTDQATKLSYLVTMVYMTTHTWWNANENLSDAIQRLMDDAAFKEISNVVAKHAKCNGVIVDLDVDGYIDHQSLYGSVRSFLDAYGITIKEFIFNPNIVLHTDNDNH